MEATHFVIVQLDKSLVFNFYYYELCWDGWTGGLWYLRGEAWDIAEVPFEGTDRAVQDVQTGTRSFVQRSRLSKIQIFEHSIAVDIMCTLGSNSSWICCCLRIQELGLRVAVRDFEREVWQRSLDNSPRAQQCSA